ncbi:hypothetical protein [Tomitella gaofuii]|uniref:hypothetical protein n=1 Tax=Tomitella gaofuii TaxID=2760083 RepID=UPI0015F8EEF8|nr:hypothetical protein [Tomitella gaofuii]
MDAATSIEAKWRDMWEAAAPNQKSRWRNFTGTPAPATLAAGAEAHAATGLAKHGVNGQVAVHFTFD